MVEREIASLARPLYLQQLSKLRTASIDEFRRSAQVLMWICVDDLFVISFGADDSNATHHGSRAREFCQRGPCIL